MQKKTEKEHLKQSVHSNSTLSLAFCEMHNTTAAQIWQIKCTTKHIFQAIHL